MADFVLKQTYVKRELGFTSTDGRPVGQLCVSAGLSQPRFPESPFLSLVKEATLGGLLGAKRTHTGCARKQF